MVKNPAYRPRHLASSFVMILALVWLTVSAPFVYEAQIEQAQWESATAPLPDNPVDNEEANPFSNSTEEKAPGANSFSEEYLHGSHDQASAGNDKLSHQSRHVYDVYVAFHGEMLCPPPNHFLS